MFGRPIKFLDDLQMNEADKVIERIESFERRKMPKKTHNGAHLLERIQTKKDKVLYKCMIPACTYFLSVPETVINKLSRCWNCDRELVITREIYNDRTRKPTCEFCKEEKRRIREEMASLPVKE